MVRMGSQENKENRDHLDHKELKELKDLQDLGVLESPTLSGETAPALTPTILNYSMLEELVGLHTAIKEEEQRSFVCLLIQTSSAIIAVNLWFLLFMEQNIKHRSMPPNAT